MKKIYAQKQMFYFMNFFTVLFAIVGIYGGYAKDSSFYSVLYASLGIFLLSLFMLINRIYYNDNEIKFYCVYRKQTVKFEDIKEIFMDHDLIQGTRIIFNLEKEVGTLCCDYMEYAKKCRELGIKNTFYFVGITKKDVKELLKNYKGKIQN